MVKAKIVPEPRLLLTMVVLYLNVLSCQLITEERFLKSPRCSGQILASLYRYSTVNGRSVLDCVAQCRSDAVCQSFIYDSNNHHCHLSSTSATSDCSNMVVSGSEAKYYESTEACQNGGNRNADGSCTCAGGYVGTQCQMRIGDCTEGFEAGHFTQTGEYMIRPASSPYAFQVHCDRWSNVTRTFIFSRQDVAFSFNRSWLEYRDGFGDLSGDFFLGLEKLHLLTKSKIYQLRFRVKLPNATLYFVYYDDFVLSDETSDYSFTFSLAKEISLGDCLTSLLGAGFSTYDRDNDGDSSVNCAQRHGGGWWFSGAACSTCNPLGPILQPFDGRRKGVDGEAFWTGFLGDVLPFALDGFLFVQ